MESLHFQTIQIALYLSSTSNHNQAPVHIDKANIALYLSSTSNHNVRYLDSQIDELRYIFLLHQTTTDSPRTVLDDLLRYIFLLHQTTTVLHLLNRQRRLRYIFLLHQTTTYRGLSREVFPLRYIFLLHQTTTEVQSWLLLLYCVISFFYIKPQHSLIAP